MIGIDTPETVDPRKKPECFGKEASAKTKEELLGKKVYLKIDKNQAGEDKYQRLLRYIYLEDGELFNKTLVEEGFAREYTYKTPYKYQKQFKKAEINAIKERKGVWSSFCLAQLNLKNLQ